MNKLKSFFNYDKLFLLIIFLIGLLATFSYGVYFDQYSEQTILFSNLKEYLLQLGAQSSQIVQDMDAAGITEISQSVEKDHGIAAYYPIGFLWFINQNSYYTGSIVWHTYTFLLVFLGVISLYYLSKELFQSQKIASFVTLLFFLTPRMFAESHYNNKDMVMVSLVFVLFYLGWQLMQNASWKNIVLFALTGAFAFNLKIIGAWFFGLIGIYALLYFIRNRQFDKRILLKCIACILLWLAAFVLITPATWNGLIEYVQYVLGFTLDFERWSSYILFNGKLVHTQLDGMPRSYLPRLIIFTTPVVILILLAVGGCFLLFDLFRHRFRNLWQKEGYVCLICILGFVPLLFAVLANTSLYNGWRHFYFTYTAVILCAGYGVYRLNQLIQTRLKAPLHKGTAGSYIILMAVTLLVNHPFQYCYYNWLAGENVQNRYDMDYWNLSTWQAYQSILKDAPDTGSITVSAFNSATTYGMTDALKTLPEKDRTRITIVEDWLTADYIIVNMTYTTMYNLNDYANIQKDYELLESFDSYGNIVCEVYCAK